MTTVAAPLFDPVQLANTATTYYTGAEKTNTIIKKLTFTNTDTSNRTVTVYIVPSGGSADATTTLISAKVLIPGETWECFEAEGHVIEPAGTLQMVASAATAITAIGSGVKIT